MNLAVRMLTNDGLDDAYNDLIPIDTDADGTPDYLDLNSDNDATLDNFEAQTPELYQPALGSDTDCDGLDDSYDPDTSGIDLSSPVDVDDDGIADFRSVPSECSYKKSGAQ